MQVDCSRFLALKVNLTLPRPSMRTYRLSSRKTEAFKYKLRINVHCSVNLNDCWCVWTSFGSLLLIIRLAEDRASWTKGLGHFNPGLITRRGRPTGARRGCSRVI